jgi:hypothetical protein
MALNNNSISILVCESNFDVRTVSCWASEVFTLDFKIGSLGVLGDTICWFNMSNSWTIVESEISTNVLPVLIILVDFNGSITCIFGWWSCADVLNI